MWFMVAIGLWLYVRPGGAIRGLWRILDGKGQSGLFLCSELRGGSPGEQVRLYTGAYEIYGVPQT
jgi:hypothetical protein